jgi:hypothetical protein
LAKALRSLQARATAKKVGVQVKTNVKAGVVDIGSQGSNSGMH